MFFISMCDYKYWVIVYGINIILDLILELVS